MKHSVEIFATSVVAIVLLALVASASYGSERETEVDLSSDLRVRPLQEGLWLVESDADWEGQTISANGLVLVSGQEVLVVDTPWTETQTEGLLDWIEQEIALPVVYFVVTHAHNDRIGGIAEVHRRGIPTYGYAGTTELALAQDFDAPQHTFVETEKLAVGDEGLMLLYPGPGHASDNIVVWFDDRKLLYGGCFIKNLGSKSLGYTGDADVEAWPTSLARLHEVLPEPDQVVPGHGAPGGAELIGHTRRLLERHSQTAPH